MKILLLIFISMFLQIAFYAQGVMKPANSPNKISRYNNIDSFNKASLEKGEAREKAKVIQQAKEDSSNESKLSKKIKEVPFIFEGTIIETAILSKKGPKERGLYTIQIVEMHKIFKGDLKCGTVKIISNGTINNPYYEFSGTDVPVDRGFEELTKGISAVFFCVSRDFSDSTITTSKIDNRDVLKIDALVYYGINNLGPGSFGDIRFKTYSILYNRLLKEPGIKMQKCDSIDYQKQQDSMICELIKKHREKDSLNRIKDTSRIHMPTVRAHIPPQPQQKGPNNQGDDEIQLLGVLSDKNILGDSNKGVTPHFPLNNPATERSSSISSQ